MILANTEDFRRLARKRLPHFLFEYIDGGAFSETTLRSNQHDLQRFHCVSAYCAMCPMCLHKPHYSASHWLCHWFWHRWVLPA